MITIKNPAISDIVKAFKIDLKALNYKTDENALKLLNFFNCLCEYFKHDNSCELSYSCDCYSDVSSIDYFLEQSRFHIRYIDICKNGSGTSGFMQFRVNYECKNFEIECTRFSSDTIKSRYWNEYANSYVNTTETRYQRPLEFVKYGGHKYEPLRTHLGGWEREKKKHCFWKNMFEFINNLENIMEIFHDKCDSIFDSNNQFVKDYEKKLVKKSMLGDDINFAIETLNSKYGDKLGDSKFMMQKDDDKNGTMEWKIMLVNPEEKGRWKPEYNIPMATCLIRSLNTYFDPELPRFTVSNYKGDDGKVEWSLIDYSGLHDAIKLGNITPVGHAEDLIDLIDKTIVPIMDFEINLYETINNMRKANA